jgi:hypothetical protein
MAYLVFLAQVLGMSYAPNDPQGFALRSARRAVGHAVDDGDAPMSQAEGRVQGRVCADAWEMQLLERQAKVRGLYLAQAQLLSRSADPTD